MDFDNLMHYDLTTGLYMFIPFLILLFWHWPYSLHNVIQGVNEIKIHSNETVSEVICESNVKFVTYVKQKTWPKGRTI